MKKVFYFLMVAGFASVMLQGCGKDPVEVPVPASVTTTEISAIAEDGFAVGGVINAGTATVTEAGVCWDTNPNPTVDKTKLAATEKSGTFSVTVTGLKSGTNYFVRAYVTSTDGKTAYGDQRSATTGGQLALTLPFVERFRGTVFPPQYWQIIDHDGDGLNWYPYASRFYGAMSDSEDDGKTSIEPYNFLISPKITISGTNPKLEWNIGYASTGGYFAEHYKVVVSTTAFTAANCVTNGNIILEETLEKLDGGRTLSPRSVNLTAYAGKDVYVAWVHYNTVDKVAILLSDIRIGSQENPATVTTPVMGAVTASNIYSSSALVTAQISNDGGVSVTSRGFCYGKSANPTIDNATVVAIADNVATTFSTELTLEQGTTYHVRAYAKNIAGITYSSDQTVTTPTEVRTTLFFEDFDHGEDGDLSTVNDWMLIDKDGDGENWEYYWDEDDQCARSYSYTSDDNDDDIPLFPENYIVSPPVDLTTDAPKLELSFKVAASSKSYYKESYKVLLSTEPVTAANCREATVIKPLETLTADNSNWNFTTRRVDLSAYKGQTVYVLFVHTGSSDEASILLTDIEIATIK